MRKILTVMLSVFMVMNLAAVNLQVANSPEEQVADYYLSHPYLFSSTTLTATGNDDYPYKNAEGENIKLNADGWSDFHWDGPSSCIFDNINMSKAGTYYLAVNYRGSTNDGWLVVNGDSTALTLNNTPPYVQAVNLKEGMNTIKVCKGTWIGVYSIELSVCPPAATAQTADFYLSNSYYFQCTTLTATGNPDYPYKNADGENIKLYADGWSDFHWDGPSHVIFDNINLSEAGDYEMTVNYRGTSSDVEVVVNGVSQHLAFTGSPYQSVVSLKAGMNTIKIGKGEWIGVYSMDLKKVEKLETTTITLDQNGGTGGEATVVAQKGKAMPELASLPTRENFFFNGYATEKDGGDLYYNADGTSAKNWDKADETFTLYAQWYSGVPEVAVNVDCPDKTQAETVDYYLSNMYYALCTSWSPRTITDSVTGRTDIVFDNGAEVLVNEDGNWFKLEGGRQYIDWHWDDFPGKSALVFNDIYVSEAGDYDMRWFQRNGGTVDIILNNDTFKTVTAGARDTLTVFRLPLLAGEPNKVKITKNSGWPQTLGIMFQKSAAVQDTTTITFDMQGGAGGTETVEAIKGNDLPTVTIPTREGFFFEGYFTEAEGGDQYYNPDGTGMKAWDKSDKTFTLYAHWNDGGTEGDCPSPADAIKEDYFFTHMYDARCTELTNTWEKDNNEYIYLNAENERIKITTNGQWMDFYWADPSSIVFDSIYVSRDMICDFKYFFRCDNIDGEPTAGARSQVWVNDELFGEMTVWISDDDVELDETTVEGIELYADWPNKIKIQKINGWPLTRGIQLVGAGLGVENTSATGFFVLAQQGGLQINRLEGLSNIKIYTISGLQVLSAQTTEKSYDVQLAPGAYIVDVNGTPCKAIVR